MVCCRCDSLYAAGAAYLFLLARDPLTQAITLDPQHFGVIIVAGVLVNQAALITGLFYSLQFPGPCWRAIRHLALHAAVAALGLRALLMLGEEYVSVH